MKKISYMKLLLIVSLMIISQVLTYSQVPPISPSQAQAELDKRGVTEAEVKTRMKQKGYDLDNIDPTNTEEVARVQKALEETIAELEAEKASQTNIDNTTVSSSTSSGVNNDQANEAVENIKEAVQEGESIENALAEEFAETVQADLPPATIWGQHLFRDKSLKLFTRSQDATPPDTYVLGAGDRINISIWGASRENLNLEVQQDGYVYPSTMSRIYLKGLNFEQTKSLLRNRFSQFYRFRPEEFQADISFVRTITVNIWGEANLYGSFNIPATNTAFNALVAVGGPSEIGSVRNIELRRGKQTKKIDVYEFMNDPTVQYGLFLQNNDIIYIPIAERLVQIGGSIKRPFIYELTSGENLRQLIEFSGGLTVDAYQKEIQIKRIINDEETIIDVPMKTLFETGQDFVLLNGDVVTIKSIPKSYENFVEIIVAVELPGKYALTSNMRISDLIVKGKLEKEARKDFAYLYRKNDDGTSQIKRIELGRLLKEPNLEENILLEPEDRLIMFQQAKFTDELKVSILGAVREPAEFPYDPTQNLKVEDLIFLAGGLLPNATNFAYIKRRRSDNSKDVEYISINLLEAVNNPLDASKNLILQPFDELTILTKETYTDEFTVTIDGAVRKPGEFIYGESMTIQDLLTLAGGLKFGASSSRIDVFRLQIRDNQPTQTIVAQIAVDGNLSVMSEEEFKIEPLDKIYVRNVPDFKKQEFISVEGEVYYPGDYALISDNERILDVLNRAGGLTLEAFPEGAYLVRRIDQPGQTIINLDKVIKNPASRDNLILKQGDVITIPKTLELVTIELEGTLAAQLYPDKMLEGGKVNVAYHSGKRAGWYVEEYAVGIDRKKRARKRLITVEHPNKRLEKYNGFFALGTPKVNKGSIISIGIKPEKEKRKKKEKEPIDWDKALAQVLTVTSTFASLVVAISVINRN